MARENQGLQIALIVFVMLTIILGVTTFVFFRQFEEATTKAKTADQNAQSNQQAAANVISENNQLKQYIGAADTAKLPEVSDQFNADMQKYAAGLVDTNLQSYREALENLYAELGKKNQDLAQTQAKVDEWETKFGLIQGTTEEKIKPVIAAHEKDKADREQELDRFNRDRVTFTTKTNEIEQTLTASHAKADETLGELQAKLEDADQQLRKLNKAVKEKSETLNEMIQPVFDVPDGKIRWVNQRAGTVWINLGRVDQLPLQLSFAVYDADATDVTSAGKKASVEVTQVLGEHLAEARILEDDVADPILPGDIIHTPIWAPGEQEHFGLTDGMDIDGDGKSDLARVKNIISAAGGVVDVWIDEEGVRSGRLLTQTRYLVVGTDHGVDTPPDVIEARTNLLRQAEDLGVRTITLSDLLNKMGYKRQTSVVRYGSGANPADFRAKPPEGAPPRSTGNVTDRFRTRRPPAGVQPRSAFD